RARDRPVRPYDHGRRCGANGFAETAGRGVAGVRALTRVMLGMLRPDAGAVTPAAAPIASAPHRSWATVGCFIDHVLAYPHGLVRDERVAHDCRARRARQPPGALGESTGSSAPPPVTMRPGTIATG